ncbi:acetylornithine aminotransferase/putrescine aminotransferase [Cribrihabitans marinus]|uniref:Acetylornithine aminotransferase/putrescine aminotransferase n=1 Tax=Cribrihabitans marinus TaxID=1227549 RepID=A0A1H7DS12_9RHOB|nr:aspartate aminotransferase family protein [Cribrihabitans marinus]GGH39980.1 aspartate aminotransferase family protein [Cribrihabitans marinus]SEK04591.1 acetylornithine aminotransferase/putrescine aminotransferase [Cribrihabitans marinus]
MQHGSPGNRSEARMDNAAAADLTAWRISTGRVSAMAATAGYPLVQGAGSGVRIADLDGNQFIDCRCAGGIFNLGHRPPEIAALIRDAVVNYDLGDWMLLSGVRARAADAIARAAPAGLDHVQFAVTGSEAVEVACKFARGATGRTRIVSMQNAYHGFSGFALGAAPEAMRATYGPTVPDMVQVPHGDLEAARAAVGADTAAVLLEVVQGSGGIILPPDGYMQGLRDLCDATGAMLILDEVQCGMGRTGRLFSFEHWGVVPEMVVIAKALGGAYYPVSACLYGARVYDYACEHPMVHPSTFSGSELGCLVAERAIGMLSDPALLTNVVARGAQLAAGYARIKHTAPDVVTDYRQIGLFTGLDTPDAETGAALRHAAVRNGLVAFTAPFRPRCLQVWPPLIITENETSELIDRLEQAVRDVAAGN